MFKQVLKYFFIITDLENLQIAPDLIKSRALSMYCLKYLPIDRPDTSSASIESIHLSEDRGAEIMSSPDWVYNVLSKWSNLVQLPSSIPYLQVSSSIHRTHAANCLTENHNL